MQPNELDEIIGALSVTAEITGTQLSPGAMMVIAEKLSRKGTLGQVLSALDRCQEELTGRLSLAAIIERIHSSDGILGAEEAWALMSNGEDVTVVITQEMAEAMKDAHHLLKEHDRIGARMAFKEAYTRLIHDAREENSKPHWFASIGHDKAGRAAPIAEAIRQGRLQLEPSLLLLSPESQVEVLQINGKQDHPLLIAHKKTEEEENQPLDVETGLRRIAEIKQLLNKKSA